MSICYLSTISEGSVFTGVNTDGQWLVYWLKVSGLNDLRELSFNTNIFLDQIAEAKRNSREGIVTHQFDGQGNHIETNFTLYEKGKDSQKINILMDKNISDMNLELKDICTKPLDLMHQKIHFEINVNDSSITTLRPLGVSWMDGKLHVEEAG